MSNLRREEIKRNMKPTDVVLGADEDGCLVNFPPNNFSGSIPVEISSGDCEGTPLLDEPEVNKYTVKKIKSADSSVTLTSDDCSVDIKVNFPAPPVVDYPVIDGQSVGSGTSVYKELAGKKIRMKSIKAGGGIKVDEENDTIFISTRESGSISSNDWFLDAAYNRPLGWLPQTTINGIPIASGSIGDPFISYEEYLLKVIYDTHGNYGNPAYNKSKPFNQGKRLQILSSVTTAKDLEVANNRIWLRNNSQIIYTGTRDYAFDTRDIYSAILSEGLVSGKLNRGYYIEIMGSGAIVNKNKLGIIYHKTDVSTTSATSQCTLMFTAEDDGFNFSESELAASYHDIFAADGTSLLRNGNFVVRGSTQAPTTPLIVLDGNNYEYYNSAFYGTRLFVQTNTQKGFSLINGAKVTTDIIDFKPQVNPLLIGYQSRLTSTATGDDAELLPQGTEINSNGVVFFKPHDGYVFFHLKDNSLFLYSSISSLNNGFLNFAANSVFLLENSSNMVVYNSYEDKGGLFAINFARFIGDSSSLYIKNLSIINSQIRYLLRGPGANIYMLTIPNALLGTMRSVTKNITFTYSTMNSISVINGNAVMSPVPSANPNHLVGTIYQESGHLMIKV